MLDSNHLPRHFETLWNSLLQVYLMAKDVLLHRLYHQDQARQPSVLLRNHTEGQYWPNLNHSQTGGRFILKAMPMTAMPVSHHQSCQTIGEVILQHLRLL